jgi:F-type H+-transporting ATPase subunit b
MLVFLVFVWFTMKFVWPPLVKAMNERQEKIADGLAAAERGRRELELSQHRAKDELKQAKLQSADIIDKANRRGVQMIDEAKDDARLEAQKIAKIAEENLVQEINRAKDTLRKQVAVLAVAGAEKILVREIDEQANREMLDHLIKEI